MAIDVTTMLNDKNAAAQALQEKNPMQSSSWEAITNFMFSIVDCSGSSYTNDDSNPLIPHKIVISLGEMLVNLYQHASRGFPFRDR